MNAKMTFYKREFESASGNSKKTWDILKEATKLGNKNVKPNFPSSFKKGEEGMTKNTLEIANGFNEYFATEGSKIAQEIEDKIRANSSALNEAMTAPQETDETE